MFRGEKDGESQKPGRQAKANTEEGCRTGAEDRYFFHYEHDEQDEQDERLLHEKLAWQMIRCGFTDAQDYKTPDS